MKTRWWIVLVGLPVALLLKGCGEGKKETDEGHTKAETKEAQAQKAAFHDWESLELKNGLARVVVVPSLGGRVMGFEFAGRSLLYANPKLYGQVPGGEPGRRQPWIPGSTTGGGTPGDAGVSNTPTDAGGKAKEAAPRPSEPAAKPAAPSPTADRERRGGVRFIADAPASAPQAAAPAKSAAGDKSAPAKPAAGDKNAPAKSEGKAGVGEAGSGPAMPSGGEVAAQKPATATESEPIRYIPSQTSERYRNYGGQVTWPAPQSHWDASWPPPLALDLGTYAATLDKSDGDTVEAQVVSPKDDKLGLEVRKNLTLFRASTVLRVVSTLKNVGTKSRLWSVADVSQHPGALVAGETFTRDVQVVMPIREKGSKLHLGFAALIGPQTSKQYNPEGGLLRVEYLGQEGLIGSDDIRCWTAYVDRRNELVLAKLANFDDRGTYPENGLTSTVYTAPAEAESYVQMSLRSALREVAPNDTLTFTVLYGAAHCPSPIVSATRAGVVNAPLTAERLAGSVHLKGVFGVFYTGFAQVAFFDKDGQTLSRTAPVSVTPTQPFRLDTQAILPDGAVRAAVVISSQRRVDVAELSDAVIAEIKPGKEGELAIQPKPAEGKPEPSTPKIDVSAEKPTTAPVRNPMPSAAEAGTPATADSKPKVGTGDAVTPKAGTKP